MATKRRAAHVPGTNVLRIGRNSADRTRRGLALANPIRNRSATEFEVRKGTRSLGRIIRTVNFKSKYRMKASSGHSGG